MKRLLLISLLLSILITSGHAQNEKYKSLFIYNFSKYIKWPDAYNSDKFVIGIIGDSPIIKSINSMAAAKKKTGGGLAIVVKTYGTIEEIGDCNILFVSPNFIDDLSQIDTRLAKKPILLVTDVPGMASRGSMINFVLLDGQINFEFNTTKVQSRGLVISSSLSGLAILI